MMFGTGWPCSWSPRGCCLPRFEIAFFSFCVSNLFHADKVPQPPYHKKTKTPSPKEDIPAAREDAAGRSDEHQCCHLGEAAQEEHQHDQEQPGPGAERAGE